jgi:hypothetical protein
MWLYNMDFNLHWSRAPLYEYQIKQAYITRVPGLMHVRVME